MIYKCTSKQIVSRECSVNVLVRSCVNVCLEDYPLPESHEAILTKIAVCRRALDVLEDRVNCAEIAGFDKGHIIIKYKAYDLQKVEIESGAHVVIDSQPFYTHREGYKLLFRLHPTGYGRGAGTHVSADLLVLVGDNDQLLKWPFKPRVRFVCCCIYRVQL
jgi:hypothetical protein